MKTSATQFEHALFCVNRMHCHSYWNKNQLQGFVKNSTNTRIVNFRGAVLVSPVGDILGEMCSKLTPDTFTRPNN